MIRQAKKQDIPSLEAMYERRVRYNDAHDIHQWNLEDVTWAALSKQYNIEDFYVVEEGEQLCAAACFVDFDPQYWPDMAPGASYYLHKICVDPQSSGKGYADQLIAFFKQRGTKLGYADVRLDVRAHKEKLRAIYERHGFTCVREVAIFEDYQTALYRYNIKEETD